MKNLIIFLITLISQLSLAQESFQKFDAVVRTENNSPEVQAVVLEDLISDDSFDGKYFKVVTGKSDEAVKFSAEKDILLRAATTYYHLSKARQYFIEKINSEYVKNLSKIVVRIEQQSYFSELGHFANDNYRPQFNTATTIPAGEGLPKKGVKPWGIEIWFSPRKETHLRDLKVNDLSMEDSKVLLQSFRNQIHMQSLQRFIAQTVTAMTVDGAGNPLDINNIVRTVGSSLFLELCYQFIDPISKAAMRKWYWLDTALVPEIIYHEYSHIALSDYLVLSHSSAVIEGMADFFAGQIAQSPELAKHIKKYNTFNGKDAKRKNQYKLEFETKDYANTDFVFGLLWEIKSTVGEDQGDAFVYALRKKVTTSSTIRRQLIEGLLETCEEECKSPFNDKLKILKLLNSRGI